MKFRFISVGGGERIRGRRPGGTAMVDLFKLCTPATKVWREFRQTGDGRTLRLVGVVVWSRRLGAFVPIVGEVPANVNASPICKCSPVGFWRDVSREPQR